MIREFDMKDLERFEPNEVSDPADVAHFLRDEKLWSYTLENDGIKAVISFSETAPDEWAMSCLISRHFNALDSRELKRFKERAVRALQPRKVWSWTIPGTVADRWHKFLGLAFEKQREFQGKIYNVWVRNYETSGES